MIVRLSGRHDSLLGWGPQNLASKIAGLPMDASQLKVFSILGAGGRQQLVKLYGPQHMKNIVKYENIKNWKYETI